MHSHFQLFSLTNSFQHTMLPGVYARSFPILFNFTIYIILEKSYGFLMELGTKNFTQTTCLFQSTIYILYIKCLYLKKTFLTFKIFFKINFEMRIFKYFSNSGRPCFKLFLVVTCVSFSLIVQ